jgi:pilus assembly protein CpaC
MSAPRGPVARIAALVIYIIVILVATPQAQQAVPSASFSGSPGTIAAGPPAASETATAIDLLVGRSTILKVGSTIARVSLTVPDVADAMVTAPQELLIHGKTPGTISLFVWDRAGGIKTYEVNVRRDLKVLAEQMTQLFPGEAISVAGSGKDVVMSGTVSSKYVIDKAADVAAGFVEKKENVVNLLKQQEGVASNQVMLRVRFAEVSRNALQELGVNLFTGATGYKDVIARSTTQQFTAPNYTDLTRTADLKNNLTASDGKFTLSDFLNLFVFSNKYNIGTVIRALETKGLFQSLAEPNLIASNGKEASFLAGGEYPYPVVQGGAGNQAVTIVFKEFGVRLSFTPTVLGGDLINLKVKPEVSALDFANGITVSGFRVPGLSTRRTETEVELQDGQTFAIAGLMNNTVSSTMSKVPGIGDVPVLGYLFRSRAYQKQQTELVVMITPQIVRRGSTGVSSALPSIVEPYLAAPSKPMPQPAPYVGSPRYPAGGGQTPQGAPRRDDEQAPPAPVSPAPAPTAPAPVASAPAAPIMPAPAPATLAPAKLAAKPTVTPVAPVVAVAPTPVSAVAPKAAEPARATPQKAAEPTKAERKAAEQQRERDRQVAEAAAKARAAEEKQAAETAARNKAAGEKNAAEQKERQKKLDAERAKREAVVAKQAGEAERKKQDEQKKKDKAVAEAAARLRQAQTAYQAEIDKAKAGGSDKTKG